MIDVLQELYDSEINFDISTLWDGGVDWKLGDEMNGYKAEGNGCTVESAILSTAMAALQHFPDSDFAKRFRAELLELAEKLWGKPWKEQFDGVEDAEARPLG